MSTSKSSTVLLAAGAAASAGIIAVAVVLALRAKDHSEVIGGRRDIEEMIAECSERIRSLEESMGGPAITS